MAHEGEERLHILVVTQYFWPENFKINDMVKEMCAKGHRITVLTGMPNYPEGKIPKSYRWFKRSTEDYYGATVIRSPLVSRGSGEGVRLGLNYLSFALSATVIGLMRCRENYDALFVYEPSPITVGIPAVVLKRKFKIPLILWVQDLWPDSLIATGAVSSPMVISGFDKLVKYIYNRCDFILVQSLAFIPWIKKYGIPSDKINYLPNWAEDVYKPTYELDASRDLQYKSLLPEGFIIMFAGNLGESQNLGMIVEAAERLREHHEIHWVMVGDGRRKEWMEKEVRLRQLDSCIHFVGKYPIEVMPYFFSVADGLLLTLKKDPIFSLTIPSKLQSYLASGRPIIASIDGEGGRILQSSGGGLVCPADDIEALAESVLQLYRMPVERRQHMAQCGRSYYEQHFDRDKLLAYVERVIHEAV